jgi:hypothetical protein
MDKQTYEKKVGGTTFIITPRFLQERKLEDIIKSAIKRDIQLISQNDKKTEKYIFEDNLS